MLNAVGSQKSQIGTHNPPARVSYLRRSRGTGRVLHKKGPPDCRVVRQANIGHPPHLSVPCMRTGKEGRARGRLWDPFPSSQNWRFHNCRAEVAARRPRRDTELGQPACVKPHFSIRIALPEARIGGRYRGGFRWQAWWCNCRVIVYPATLSTLYIVYLVTLSTVLHCPTLLHLCLVQVRNRQGVAWT